MRKQMKKGAPSPLTGSVINDSSGDGEALLSRLDTLTNIVMSEGALAESVQGQENIDPTHDKAGQVAHDESRITQVPEGGAQYDDSFVFSDNDELDSIIGTMHTPQQPSVATGAPRAGGRSRTSSPASAGKAGSHVKSGPATQQASVLLSDNDDVDGIIGALDTTSLAVSAIASSKETLKTDEDSFIFSDNDEIDNIMADMVTPKMHHPTQPSKVTKPPRELGYLVTSATSDRVHCDSEAIIAAKPSTATYPTSTCDAS